MVAEVYAGISAFKSMLEIVKSIKNMNDVSARQRAVIELQEKILAAQATQAELIETIGELKKRVADLEAWETEKQRYELKDVGHGSLAYAIKESVQGAEPPHNICANCYQRGHKRILQPRKAFVQVAISGSPPQK